MMKHVFEQPLGISKPWVIKKMNFDVKSHRFDIHIDFKPGTQFDYTSEEENIKGKFPAHDTKEKIWRHLNFFQHECYIHCRVPRVKPEDGKIRQIKTPWAGKSLGFTLLFEALLMQLCCEMPVNAVSRLTGVNDNKIWRMLDVYVEETREHKDFASVTQLGIDETSQRKHHNYITLFVDLKSHKTIFVT